jgi:MFS family permease
MVAPLTDVEKLRRLPWLVIGDLLNNAFVVLTFDGPVFILYLNELNLDNTQISILLALIPFCGLVAPFVGPLVTRFGPKRVFVTFWGIRKLVMALMLLTPVVLVRSGPEWAFFWVAGVIFFFALCRSTAETGHYPWRQEIIPRPMIGKFNAINSITSTIAGVITLAAASYVIDLSSGLNRFMLLIGVGVVLGLLAVWAYSLAPGGAPSLQRSSPEAAYLQGIKQALRDRQYLFFLGALALVTIGGASVLAFIPLFMKNHVGLSEGNVVLLTVGTYLGILLSSYLWGWSADRYGSKPVMQASLYMMLALPVCWFLTPRGSLWSIPVATAIAFLSGIATLAWQISWVRYLFVNAVPTEQKTPYMMVYYAWLGLVSGCGPLIAGQVLDAGAALRGQWLFFTIDAYTPLFALSFIFLLLGVITASRLQSGEAIPLGQFVGLFTRGNPLKALRSLAQYNWAGDETTLISTTEQMGDAQNPLSIRELLEALHDPSFNVRYEAINSIGRMPPDPQLVEALLRVLDGLEIELSVAATRSLGKLGDKRAIPALRQKLSSTYPLLQANTARVLGTLGDVESRQHLLEKFRNEADPTLRIAYVSALGRLQVAEAVSEIFELLRGLAPDNARAELALALARIAGEERYYLRHWRSFRTNLGTAAAQAVLGLQKLTRRLPITSTSPSRNLSENGAGQILTTLAEACAQHFAQGDTAQGAKLLAQMSEAALTARLPNHIACILHECNNSLIEFGDSRPEFILLALHTLDIALRH